MIIVIEGGDGCGKSTMGKALAQAMSADFLEFPCDDGMTGPMIREYLSHQWSIQSDDSIFGTTIDKLRGALAFQSLQLTNRLEFMQRIREAEDIVLVRYWQSGYVYGSLDGLNPQWLIDVQRTLEQPDLNILLDLDTDTSLKRQVSRGESLERYEGKREFTERVLDSYRELWLEQATECEAAWPIVDASKGQASVFNDIVNLIGVAR